MVIVLWFGAKKAANPTTKACGAVGRSGLSAPHASIGSTPVYRAA
jgi:hypothetical protein